MNALSISKSTTLPRIGKLASYLAIAICVALPIAASASPITVPDGDFATPGNGGSKEVDIGGAGITTDQLVIPGATGGKKKIENTSPWTMLAETDGTNTQFVSLSPNEGGVNTAEISNQSVSATSYAAIYQTLSAVYQPNTSYTFSVLVKNYSANTGSQNLSGLQLNKVGIGLTYGGNNTGTEGTYIADSVTANFPPSTTSPYVTLTGASGSSPGTLNLTITTGVNNPFLGQNIGLRIFSEGVPSLNHIYFANATVDRAAVPEPSTVVLASIFGLGMLFLLRRRRIS